jgi:hypothetical protein
MADLFLDSVAEIRAAYARLGHRLGWRFLATPRRTLARDARAAFLTLNPGGDRIDPTHGVESCEAGSAYVHERWGFPPGASPLQRQVRAMFAWLGLDPNATLSAYFIPFRSPSYSKLVAPEESFAFGVTLWRKILTEVQPALVICMGKPVESGLQSVWGRPMAATPYPVGWGAQTAVLSRYAGNLLLRLPHLSRFAVFERHASAEPLRVIRREIARHLAALGY